MRESSRLRIDISDLRENPGRTKDVHLEEPLTGLSLEMSRVPEDEPVRVDLRLDSIVDGVHASGTVEARATFECRRCLGEFTEDFSVTVGEVFAYPGAVEGGEEDTYPVEGDEIDLEPMVRDAVMLLLPVNPVCREDCKGLCPVCGEDLNVGDCGHSAERTDVRWEALRNLKDRMEGN